MYIIQHLVYWCQGTAKISRVGWGWRSVRLNTAGNSLAALGQTTPPIRLTAANPRPARLTAWGCSALRRGQGGSPLHPRSSPERQRGADDICPPCRGSLMSAVVVGALLSRARHNARASRSAYTRRRKRRKPLTSRRISPIFRPYFAHISP